jgi:DNA-binding NarL/FixJ family response regulator
MIDKRRARCGRVLIADDDEGVRTLLRDLLDLEGYNTIAADCGESALAAARKERPAVALLDVNLPAISGYEVCAALRRLYGDAISIIFVSGDRVESRDRVAGFLLGADDYIVKPFAPDELLARVRVAFKRLGSPGGDSAHLTGREREVLQLLANGLEQGEIATQLVISGKTVGTHIERILSKLGVHSRAQAVAVAYRDGFVSPTA